MAGAMSSSFKMKDKVFCPRTAGWGRIREHVAISLTSIVSCAEFGDAEVVIGAPLVDVAGLCTIGRGVISSTSESSLIIVCSTISLSKALFLALGMSVGRSASGLHTHNRLKKVSDSLPIRFCNL